MGYISNSQWHTAKAARESYIHDMKESGYTHVKGTGQFSCWFDRDGVPFVLVLLAKNFGRGHGYGIKDMCSTVCPYYYDISSAKWLKKQLEKLGLEPFNENERKWLENCFAVDARRQRLKQLVAGTVLTLNKDVEFTCGWEYKGAKLQFKRLVKGTDVQVFNPSAFRLYTLPAKDFVELEDLP